jgi:hypothetical protein
MLESPFMARLCELFAERLEGGDPVSDRLIQWPVDGSALQMLVALRIAGGLHGLVLEGRCDDLAAAYPPNNVTDLRLWQAVQRALHEHAPFLLDRLARAPQTNEVRRAGIVVPGFLEIAARTRKPLMLSEIGASAGINLHWDQFGYRFGDRSWGNKDSPVQLEPAWSGAPPHTLDVVVVDRAGCDLYPIDPSNPEDRLRMLSYIWADQAVRLQRTQAALDVAAASSIRVDAADVLDWLPDRLATQPPGTTHIVCHTIVWQYFPETTKARAKALLEAAGARATEDSPLAWLSFEADSNPHGAALRLRLWPGVKQGTGDVQQKLARADFHGRWVEWSGDQ